MLLQYKTEVMDLAEKSWDDIRVYFNISHNLTLRIMGKYWDNVSHYFVEMTIKDERGLYALKKLERSRFSSDPLILTVKFSKKKVYNFLNN